jgi:mRNA-degrading endonuclease RelE of RelBE toxin-antitoxin system
MAKELAGLAFAPAAVHFLNRMRPGKMRAQVAKKAKALIRDSHPQGCKKVIGMRDGDDQVWRIRCGDYRILYIVRGIIVVVLDIDHRKDVYR